MLFLGYLKRLYLYFTEDPIKAHKISSLKTSYKDLESFLLASYPAEPIVSAIHAIETIDELVTGIAERKWTAENVMRVYCLKSFRLHKEYNFITEQWIEEAVAQATKADATFSATGRLIGSLHGLPIVLNDDIDVKGYDSTVGCKCGCLKPKYMDAAIVESLKAQGAIPFCKTNVSWHLLSGECSNTVFGQTVNPLNKRVSPGGSSGGVAALVTAGGALLGIGTDTVGGLRLPANHTNLYALKPTSTRLPHVSSNPTPISWLTIPRIPGPVSQTLENITTVFKSILQREPWQIDPTIVPLPWNGAIYSSTLNRKLRIGYYTHDEFFRSLPPGRRAVHRALDILHAQGHEIVQFHPPHPIDGIKLLAKLFSIDTSQPCTFLREFQQDERSEPIIPLMLMMRCPDLVRMILGIFFERFMEDHTVAQLVTCFANGLPEGKGREFETLVREKEEYGRRFASAWNSSAVDVVICPVHAVPALPSTSFPYISAGSSYTMLYSLLDYPVGVIPNLSSVSFSDRIEETLQYVHSHEEPWQPPGTLRLQRPPAPPAQQGGHTQGSPHIKGNFNFLGILGVEEFNSRVEDGGITKGVGVGVQVVGRRFEEERILAVMECVRRGLEEEEEGN